MRKLYLVPTPIGNLDDMPFRAVKILKEADLIVAEDTRDSGKLLKQFEMCTPMQSHHIHDGHQTAEKFTEMIKSGQNIALISDAGTPPISGSGFILARTCIAND